MKPKRKDLTQTYEQIQSDHELFLQAFEKPTQIYRYLRNRNIVSPIFLNRTLNYNLIYSSRKSSRKKFKLNDILEKVESKHKTRSGNVESYRSEFMNLTFLGFYNDDLELKSVRVTSYLVKICHNKRKDVSSPLTRIELGNVNVACNPLNATPSKAEAVSIKSEHFKYLNGHAVRSFKLVLSVSHHSSLDDGPPAKRLRHSEVSADATNWSAGTSIVEYEAELVIYDKHCRCLLIDGDYEIVMNKLESYSPSKKPASWETVLDGKNVGPFVLECPLLKFKINWNKSPLEGVVDIPADSFQRFMTPCANTNQLLENGFLESGALNQQFELSSLSTQASPRKKRIFYQFMYNNNTRQQTEARDDLHCPWCSLNCRRLYNLLKHLRNCHSRFNFTYTEQPKGARIDVAINENYDGSYVGNPQDLHSHLGFAFSRSGPVRRTPVTHVLCYKPKIPCLDLSEFVEPETEIPGARQFIHGHNRLYYHTVTHQPIRPQEIDIDSEDEHDPRWLREKTVMMIDEFTDVNEGEKEIMKMWNLHIMHFNYLADCQMLSACLSFVELHGLTLVTRNLCRNFILHVINLHDYGLLTAEQLHHVCIQLSNLQQLHSSMPRLELNPISHHSSTTNNNTDSACRIGFPGSAATQTLHSLGLQTSIPSYSELASHIKPNCTPSAHLTI